MERKRKRAITSIGRKDNTKKLHTLRMSGNDEDALKLLEFELQKILPNKTLNKSKILRCCGYLYKDKVAVKKLAKCLMEQD